MPIRRKNVAAEVSPRAQPARRPLLTRAARRDIRHASALANELKCHSFRVHVDGTITWTLWHEASKESLPAELESSEAVVSKTETSKRKLKSAQRASAHRELMSRAQDFFLRKLICRWAASAAEAATDDTMGADPSPPPAAPPLPPPGAQPTEPG